MKNKTNNLIIILKKLSSANSWRKAFLLLITALLFSYGCRDENDLGLNILPPSDQIGTDFSDTATVLSSTAYEDTLQTDELSIQLLGSDLDPVFGLTTASIFTQVSLAGTPAFADSIVADSLVLSLAYLSYYGDTNLAQTVTVYRMSEQMYVDSDYYSNRIFSYDSANPLGTLTFSPAPKSPVFVDSVEAIPQIRIKLPQWLADSLVWLNGQQEYSSNAKWLEYFKGLFIKAENANAPGAISQMNFFNSAMSLYFHDSASSYTYNFSLKDGRLNHFFHDYNGSAVQANVGSDTDTVNYLMGMSGLKTKISFPHLKHFTDSGNILINRAELQITSQTPSATSPLPSRLILVTNDAAGNVIFPIDYYEASGYYGGGLNSTTNGYTFNITRHLQRYLDGTEPSSDFVLAVSGSGVDPSRAVIRSATNGLRMKLSISYTKTR